MLAAFTYFMFVDAMPNIDWEDLVFEGYKM